MQTQIRGLQVQQQGQDQVQDLQAPGEEQAGNEGHARDEGNEVHEGEEVSAVPCRGLLWIQPLH